jgi:hypothetical protein
LDARLGFEIHASTLAAVRERATGLGIDAERIDGLMHDLRAERDGRHDWVTSPFFLDLALRRPSDT